MRTILKYVIIYYNLAISLVNGFTKCVIINMVRPNDSENLNRSNSLKKSEYVKMNTDKQLQIIAIGKASIKSDK